MHGEDSGSDVELDELAESLGPAFESRKRKRFRSHLLLKLWKKCQTVTLLFLLGIFVAVITFTMDKTVSSLENAKLSLLLTTIATNSTETTTKTTTFTSMLLYLFVSLTLAIVALALVRLVPMATGSGIPRMKSLFSGGIYFHYFLSWRTLFVKTVGLTCAYAAGLTVGKEGPFVHIAACVATLLTRFSPFKRYADVSRLRHGLLATACATGVVAAFGCPFGGIIFAIEAVSTYFVVRSLPHMFISTTVASVCLRFFDPSQYVVVVVFNLFFTRSTGRQTNITDVTRKSQQVLSSRNVERRDERHKIQRHVIYDGVAIYFYWFDMWSHVRCVYQITCISGETI